MKLKETMLSQFFKQFPSTFYAVALVLLFSAGLVLAGCNEAVSDSSEPPLPTVVQVTPTPTLLPATSTPTEPAPTATSVTEPVETAATELPSAADGETAGAASNEQTDVESESGATLEPPTPSATPTTVPPTPTPTVVEQPALEALNIGLVPVADGFEKPLYVIDAGDGSGRLFVVEQPGRIQIVKDGITNETPYLDIVSLVGSNASEQGLLSVAFHPNYGENGFFFVNYTNTQGDTVIARYRVSDNPDLADPNSAKVLMTIGQPYANHNGGHVLFGPDGYLYIGMGDGGAANDPENRAQDLGTLLGKILRIDVDNADPYGVPPDNPFVGNEQARPEIWSYGWRNPWRIAFDPRTNDMYVADVGQNQYEEVHVEPAGSNGGRNYGWRLMEGFHCFNPAQCDPEALDVVLPVTEYDHSQGCSITGGYVYRGSQFPALTGTYFYGDFCTGLIWGLRGEADGSWSQALLARSDQVISSFGQVDSGEVYLVDHKGTIYQLTN